jgi:fermentation-respiration switch protein FrsA (DUF1100 family)
VDAIQWGFVPTAAPRWVLQHRAPEPVPERFPGRVGPSGEDETGAIGRGAPPRAAEPEARTSRTIAHAHRTVDDRRSAPPGRRLDRIAHEPIEEEAAVKTDIEFPSADGMRTLRGTVHVPDAADRPVPSVIVSPGFGDVIARLEPVVEAFLAAGLGVLAYDHATFGASGGEPRHEVDPVAQVRDLRMAVTVARRHDRFDPDRVGLWGMSFSGAHVLSVAAWDRRIRAVVSQVPWIAGRENVLRMGGEEALVAFAAVLDGEREALLDRAVPSRGTIARRRDDDSPGFALFSDDDSAAYFTSGPAGASGPWDNTFTLRSIGYAQEYDVRPLARLISPTPLLMVVARYDAAMPADLATEFYDAALEPKELVVLDGGHYDVYRPGEIFDEAMDVTTRWFTKHL